MDVLQLYSSISNILAPLTISIVHTRISIRCVMIQSMSSSSTMKGG